ncbi:hypothetical protein GDO81_008229 [Engystomops pustulosus]|uniref:Uncharacterized protein n=1 Tax=Engystomops pustulosus TaxID=76066 RepID=A0AAV7CD51_ENGPU|nr:hypothetical protein GDO81_008229 [Engystomops pustulosus]
MAHTVCKFYCVLLNKGSKLYFTQEGSPQNLQPQKEQNEKVDTLCYFFLYSSKQRTGDKLCISCVLFTLRVSYLYLYFLTDRISKYAT